MIRFEAPTVSGATQVLIGDLAEAAETLRSIGQGPLPLVTDQRLLVLYGERLRQQFALDPILVPKGEAAKSWDVLRHLVERFAELGVSRSTPVVAFGGGSIGDVTGLAASLFKRGCPIVHIPTTLLAQVDSALGGKTAIDAVGQKNLVGSFHMPALIVADPAFLDSLDQRQLRSGYAELVKYGLIDDRAFFAWCEKHCAALLGGDAAARTSAIEHCLRAKARFVSEDLRDTAGQRALLNLGHSFAHAIEAAAGLSAIPHGEAVAVGLCLAFAFSEESGLCPAPESERMRQHLAGAGLPTRLADVGLAGAGRELLPFIQQDKKADRGALTLVLARGIGAAFVDRGVDPDALGTFLSRAP